MAAFSVQGLKPQIFFMARTAGINACSTPWGKNFFKSKMGVR